MGRKVNITFYWVIAADQQVCSQPFGSNYSVLKASAENASQCGNECLRNDCVSWPEGTELSAGTHLTWIPAHTALTNQGRMKNTVCNYGRKKWFRWAVWLKWEEKNPCLHLHLSTSFNIRQERRKKDAWRIKRSLAGPNWPCKESGRPVCQMAAGWRNPGVRAAVFLLDNPSSTQQQQGGQREAAKESQCRWISVRIYLFLMSAD